LLRPIRGPRSPARRPSAQVEGSPPCATGCQIGMPPRKRRAGPADEAEPARLRPIREDRLRCGKNPKDAAGLKDTWQVGQARREEGSNPARAVHRERGDLDGKPPLPGDVAAWEPQRTSACPQCIEGAQNLRKANQRRRKMLPWLPNP
jgi:hypothetical protein